MRQAQVHGGSLVESVSSLEPSGPEAEILPLRPLDQYRNESLRTSSANLVSVEVNFKGYTWSWRRSSRWCCAEASGSGVDLII
ncbi:hypothetical protein AVEN_3334-1 [Araneus ventricosus]|uniref:Uncharacterized protein n=1 Tax=Araneus ventricosus TaxID=182803 RepID=A0A4Y2LSL8_ARAVE|nr:hypothetical protein AVEN_3334-1 [Araneus ventricosus]